MDLAIDKKLVIKEREGEQYIYAAKYYYMEMNTAAMLKELDVAYDVPQIEIESRIRGIEKSTGMELDQLQAQAVIEAACNGLMQAGMSLQRRLKQRI